MKIVPISNLQIYCLFVYYTKSSLTYKSIFECRKFKSSQCNNHYHHQNKILMNISLYNIKIICFILPHVFGYITSEKSSIRTKRTEVLFGTRMCQLMPIKRTGFSSSIGAQRTGIWAFPRVTSLMRAEV